MPGAQDGRPEGKIRRVQDGVVIGVSRTAGRREALDQLGQPVDPEPSCEVVVEVRDRLAEQDRVVLPPGIRCDEPTPDDVKVEPGALCTCRGGQAPRRTGRAVTFADVRDPHPGIVSRLNLCVRPAA
jgi:hypothetical protein